MRQERGREPGRQDRREPPTEPPEVLGHLIGSALVGTFLGVLISYGFVGPLSSAMRNTTEADARYFHCMKAGLIAHMQG